ncbi:MAG: VOC family protein [Rhodothermales bacterium]|nr:VOC family protein [Rhodothermales bacterium]
MHPSITHGAFSWSELMTADPDAAIKFYATILPWANQTMPMPQGDYHLQKVGEKPVAGVMAPPDADIPTAWVHYITVDDVDDVAARAVELGGNGSFSYNAIDNEAVTYCNTDDGGFTDLDKWTSLSGGIQTKYLLYTDIAQVVGAGPFDLAPGNSTEVAFALVAAESVDDVLLYADNAQRLWNEKLAALPTGVGTSRLPDPDVSTSLGSPYPNPTAGPVTFPVQIGRPVESSLVISDILGRAVARVPVRPSTPGRQ